MTRRRHLHSVGEIAQMLNARALEVAQRIFPAGRREGNEWCVLDLSGAPGDNLSVCIRGAKAGIWKQWNSAEPGGDMLKLVQLAICNGDMKEAIRWSKAFLGLDGADPVALKRTHQAVEQQKRAPSAREDAAALRGAAYRIVTSSRPEIRGTPVEAYLAGRGLEIRRLLHPVKALRYHPELLATPRDVKPRLHFPAMIAPIYNFAGRFLAVHRTWLQPQPDGRVTKAPVDNPKKTLGTYAGGFIPLWRGLVTDEETGEIRWAHPVRQMPQASVWLDITEGIEDGLTVALAAPEARVLVGVALASMAHIRFPRSVAGVTFWQQNDPEFLPDGRPHPARAAFARVVANAHAQGLRVRSARVTAGLKDVNELVQQAGEAKRSAG